MKAPKPIVHADDHRPRGWNAPTDPGGADPFKWMQPPAYVFLGEFFGVTDDYLTIPDISQDFAHLVVEASLYQDADADGDPLEDLWIQWGPDAMSFASTGYVSGAVRFFSTDNPTAAEGLWRDNMTSSSAVVIPEVIPGGAATFLGAQSVTMKFPYYTLTDRPPTVIVQAVCFPFGPGDGIERAIVYGGGSRPNTVGPVGAIRLNASETGTQGLDSQSRACLYGVRGS